MKQYMEQMDILSEMSKITIDKNDYDKALKTLGEGIVNLSTLHENWCNMVAYFSHIASYIEVNLSTNMPKISKWAEKIAKGELPMRDIVMKMILKTMEKVFTTFLYRYIFSYGKYFSGLIYYTNLKFFFIIY